MKITIKIIVCMIVFVVLMYTSGAYTKDCALEIKKPMTTEYVMGISEIKVVNVDTSCAWQKIEIYIDRKLTFSPSFMPFDGYWNFGSSSESHEIKVIGYQKSQKPFMTSVNTTPLATTYYREVDLVEVYAAVLNQRGTYVHGLTKDDFVILVDGKPITVSNFSNEDSQLSLILLMDVSTTMTPYIEKSRIAAISFLDKLLKPKDRISLVCFNDRIILANALTDNKYKILASLVGLRAGGGTSLYDAILYGLNMLQPVKGRKVIFIFSDGKDETSVISLQTALEAIRGREPTIFAIGFGQALGSPILQSFLERIAATSGGSAYFTGNIHEINELYNKIAMQIRAQYVLSFFGSEFKKDGAWHKIEVKVKNQNYKIFARDGFYSN